MTDNTPGTRDEKHTAADFATAKFARDPGGDATAHRTPMGFWTSRTFHGIDDEAMALGGWSPVRERPHPDAHSISEAIRLATPCSCSAQRARAEKAERAAQTLGKVVEDQCRDIARITRSEHLVSEDGDADWEAIWSRGHDMATRLEQATDRVDVLRDEVARVVRERDEWEANAEQAEKERDEARAAMSELAPAEVCVRGFWFKPSELPEVLGRVMDSRNEAQREAKRYYIRSTEPRPLTAEVTDEMVERARQRGSELVGALWDSPVVEAMLTAALTPEPQRPEGAEEIEAILSELPDTMVPATDAGRADLLASRGVRVVGEERS